MEPSAKYVAYGDYHSNTSWGNYCVGQGTRGEPCIVRVLDWSVLVPLQGVGFML